MKPQPRLQTAALLAAALAFAPARARCQFAETTGIRLRESLADIKRRAVAIREAVKHGQLAATAPRGPLDADRRERLKTNPLLSMLKSRNVSRDRVMRASEAIESTGNELDFFEREIAPSLPSAHPPQLDYILNGLQRYASWIRRDPIFAVPAGHWLDGTPNPIESRRGNGVLLRLVDGRGEEHSRMLLFLRSDSLIQNASIVLHEAAHGRHLSIHALARALGRLTGIPPRFLYFSVRQFTEGNAQHLTRLYLGRILMNQEDPFARALRDSLEQELRNKGKDFLEPRLHSPQGMERYLSLLSEDGTLSDWNAQEAIELREAGLHHYSRYLTLAREFPSVPSRGYPLGAIVTGDLLPLVESWSEDRRRAIAILAAQARSYQRDEDKIPEPLRPLRSAHVSQLTVEISEALNPLFPYAQEDARFLVDLQKQIYDEQARRLTPGGR